MRFQFPLKTFRLGGRIMQRIRQWVQNRHTGDWESPSAKSTATKPRNIQFAKAGWAEMLAAGNFGDWHAAIGEVLWSSAPQTPMNRHSKLVLNPSYSH